MKVIVWGCRGSVPVAINAREVRNKILSALEAAGDRTLDSPAEREAFVDKELPFSVRGTYGGNTTCVEIQGAEDRVICDAGTGLRELGNQIMQAGGKPARYHFFITHFHYDHMAGFPFFPPAYIPGNELHFYGCHSGMEEAFRKHQDEPFFPVPLSFMQAERHFHKLEPGSSHDIAGMKVSTIEHDHPGKAYGYRFERGGKTFVFSTDCEHRSDMDDEHYPFVEFFKNADVVLFDAQFALKDLVGTKENWGHSSGMMGTELAVRSRAKHLILTHHDPAASDVRLEELLEKVKHYAQYYGEDHQIELSIAYDGMELDL